VSRPGHARGRAPARDAASTSSIDNANDTAAERQTEPIDALAGMRRRREAALRLQPLADGKRDPQFGYARDGAACS
jgi:hypothetical protein